jgi:hypothetical protein
MRPKPKSEAISPTASSPGEAKAERDASEKLQYTQHIELGDFGRSLDGNLYQEVKFEYEGEIRQWMLPLAGLTPRSPEFQALTNDGARLISTAACAELIRRMQSCEPSQPKFRVATRLGFIDGTFVLPGYKIGPDKDNVRICLPAGRSERFSRYHVGGSLNGWRRLAKLAIGNTRLMLLIAAAYSGPVAALLKLEQIGLLLSGPPEAGKSTIAIAAGSVFGCALDPNMAAHLGFVLPLNATDNDIEDDIEDELLAANHTLLPIDETRSAGRTDKEIGESIIALVMRLDSGFKKGRSNSNTTRQFAAAPLIMTSNLSLGQLGAAAGRKVDDALHGRLITIPAPANVHGMFEDLHGQKDVVAFSELIRRRATRYFGHASRSFLEALVQENADDPETLREWLEKKRQDYLGHADNMSAPGRHMNRIHEKMATVYAAARFAIRHRVLPWARQDLRDSLLACTRDHVELVASEASFFVAPTGTRSSVMVRPEREHLLGQLREHVRANREKIIDITVPGAGDGLVADPSEWPILKNMHKTNGVEYLFTDNKLRSIFGDKSQVQALKDALKSDGHIAIEPGSDGVTRYSIKRTIPGRKRRAQVVAINAAAIDDNS